MVWDLGAVWEAKMIALKVDKISKGENVKEKIRRLRTPICHLSK